MPSSADAAGSWPRRGDGGEEEILVRREIELADGHAQYRFSGYVTVSAPDPGALEEACGRRRAGGGTGLPRTPAVLRGPGRRLHVHASPRPRPFLTPGRAMGNPHTRPPPATSGLRTRSCPSRGSRPSRRLAPGGRGVLIGRDLLGATFAYDPFELYRRGHLTNPNMVVIGQIGRGKSAFVKTYLWRLAVLGRRAWVVDPKGEYGALARAWGVEPVALRPGGSIRLNPLDAVPSALGGRDRRRGRGQRRAASCWPRWRRRAWDGPAPHRAQRRRSGRGRCVVGRTGVAATRQGIANRSYPADGGRRAACTPRSTPPGRWAPTSPAWPPTVGTWRSSSAGWWPVTSAACSTGRPRLACGSTLLSWCSTCPRSTTRPRLGILMTCATAWLQAGLGAGPAPATGPEVRTDEVAARRPGRRGGRRRRRGVGDPRQPGRGPLAPVVVEAVAGLGRVQHRRAPPAVGPRHHGRSRVRAGRVGPGPAGGLRDPGRLRAAARRGRTGRRPLLGLSSTEAELVPHLRRGVALWKVGTRSFLVQHRLSPLEGDIVDTDARMERRVDDRR